MIRLADIERALAARPPEILPAAPHAAVALILHEDPSLGLRLLFIERARRPDDPWSGHLAFPGGRTDVADDGARATAERETREEVGLDLARARLLGRLDDLSAVTRAVNIAALAYSWPGREAPDVVLGPEAARAFWIPLERLLAPGNQAHLRLEVEQMLLDLPAVNVLGNGEPVLWGVTFRILERLCERIGHPVPARPLLRPERPGDRQCVRAILEAAFPGPDEAELVEGILERGGAALALVAERRGEAAGHVFITPVAIEGTAASTGPARRVVALGPLAVLPAHQRQGVGSWLVRRALADLRESGQEAVVVLGSPAYYGRFGFGPASRLGLRCEFKAPPEAFMVLELLPGGLAGASGLVRFAPEFYQF